jgi:hypothetical protein
MATQVLRFADETGTPLHSVVLQRRFLDGTYCALCGGQMRDGHHIDPLDDEDHRAEEENGKNI